jgi:hypothetical protein
MFDKIFGTMVFKTPLEKAKLKVLFEAYMENIPDNFYKNQFELAKEIEGSTYEDWVKILTHPAFDTWKAQQIAIIATIATDQALAGGENLDDKNTLNLLKVRQEVLKDEKKTEKPVVIVIPDSLFFKGEGSE